MHTPEATLSVLFMAILILDHGNRAVGQNTTNKGQWRQKCQLWNTTFEGDVTQDPRFAGVRRGQSVRITCGCSRPLLGNTTVTWFRGHENGSFISYVLDTDPNVEIQAHALLIKKVQIKHSGIYYCNFTSNGVTRVPCGTELMVLGTGSQATAKSRNTMKDAIIMIQTILIVLFITVPVMLLMEMKKKRSLKIEDHTYEGLEAYQTATYEDIQTVRVLAAKTMEGEHPCVE